MATIITPDGNQMIIPDFALESTAKDMLEELEKISKGTKTTNDQLKELVKYAKESAKKVEKDEKESDEDRNKAQKTLDKIKDNLKTAFDKQDRNSGDSARSAATGRVRARIAKSLNFIGSTVKVLGGALSLVIGALQIAATAFTLVSTAAIGAVTALSRMFLGVGDELNRLTEYGTAFADGGYSAINALADFTAMGLDAVDMLSQFSNVAQSIGKREFANLAKEFTKLTNAGADLGLTLEASTERFAKELSRRQRLGALEGIQQQQLTQQITRTISQQQKYASALGVSTDEIQGFVESLFSNVPVLTASLNRLSSDVRSQVIAGVTDFASAMRGLGGQDGGQIAEAFTEAAASGAMGFSDAMVGYVTALPSLSGPMNDYIEAVQNGTLTQEEAESMAQDLAMQIGNVSQSERDRVFALARAGDQYAQSMARAITQFEQSEAKIRKLGLDPNAVQRGTNLFNTMISQVTGTFSSLRYSFLEGVSEVGDLADTFANARTLIWAALQDVFAGFGGIGNDVEDFGKILANRLPDLITWAGETIATLIRKVPVVWETVSTAFNSVADFIRKWLYDSEGKLDFSIIMDKMKEKAGQLWESFKSWMWSEALPGVVTALAAGAAAIFAASVIKGAIVTGISALFGGSALVAAVGGALVAAVAGFVAYAAGKWLNEKFEMSRWFTSDSEREANAMMNQIYTLDDSGRLVVTTPDTTTSTDRRGRRQDTATTTRPNPASTAAARPTTSAPPEITSSSTGATTSAQEEAKNASVFTGEETQKQLLELLISEQRKTNKLLKDGNNITRDNGTSWM